MNKFKYRNINFPKQTTEQVLNFINDNHPDWDLVKIDTHVWLEGLCDMNYATFIVIKEVIND